MRALAVATKEPSPWDSLSHHVDQLERQLANGDEFVPLLLHDIEGVIKAFRALEKTECRPKR